MVRQGAKFVALLRGFNVGGKSVIFWSVSKHNQKETTFSRLQFSPAYRQFTIRNHNAVLKLQQMLSDL